MADGGGQRRAVRMIRLRLFFFVPRFMFGSFGGLSRIHWVKQICGGRELLRDILGRSSKATLASVLEVTGAHEEAVGRSAFFLCYLCLLRAVHWERG